MYYGTIVFIVYLTLYYEEIEALLSTRILNSRTQRWRVFSGDNNDKEIVKAMENARNCEKQGLSPGAGLCTAEEQAEAAYADLINTSMDQRGIDLSQEEIDMLSRGGTMWESGSKSEKNKGLFGNLKNIFGALAGGAHIEKNEFGET
jgi:hypothetical protein